MKILFISRAYPPTIGGIENQNYAVSKWLCNLMEVTTIANHGGKKSLPFFFPKAFFQALRKRKDYDIILLGDGVLAPLGWILRIFTGKPVASIIHGLDITYTLPLYQWLWVGFFLPKLNRLIAVSRYTKEIAIEHGLTPDAISIIPNGVENPPDIGIHYVRIDLADYIGRDLSNVKVLTTIGRLTKRKGVAWFVEFVLPKLPENFIYVIAGSGSEKPNILAAAERAGVTDRVKLLGAVPDEIKMMLHRTADLFIQPNITVPGDMEGFGISIIEATLAGLPVIASKIEGIQDAIIDGETGIFVESKDADGFVNAIKNILSNEESYRLFRLNAAKVTKERFHWDAISKLYAELLEKEIPKKDIPGI
ncbi:MAG: glycosyltransferase family 4 protein [Candidatus Moranbacteria bacterium]|nr:glycosyltransferase family 4 protein [Candidatus Moranbacteria bacterium]